MKSVVLPVLYEFSAWLQSEVDAYLIAADCFVSSLAAMSDASASLFWCLSQYAPTGVFATTEQVEVGEVAVLAVAVTERYAVTVWNRAVGLLPDISVFQHHWLTHADLDVGVAVLVKSLVTNGHSARVLMPWLKARLDVTLHAFGRHKLFDALAFIRWDLTLDETVGYRGRML